MSNDMDANIKLLYPVDKNSFFTIEDVGQGKEFDVIANVEIGEDLNEVVNRHEVRVGIVNLTQSKAVGTPQTFSENCCRRTTRRGWPSCGSPSRAAGTLTPSPATSCRRSPPTRSRQA